LRQQAVELAVLLRLLQLRHQGRRREEAQPLALPADGQAKGRGDVRLLGPGLTSIRICDIC
jgi:hypothetical protein